MLRLEGARFGKTGRPTAIATRLICMAVQLGKWVIRPDEQTGRALLGHFRHHRNRLSGGLTEHGITDDYTGRTIFSYHYQR